MSVTSSQAGLAEAPPADQTNSTIQGGNGFSLDPKQWVIDALGAAFSWMFSGITSALTGFLQQVIALNIIVQTPAVDTYQNPAVLLMWRALVVIAYSALALVIAWGGYNVMVRDAIGVRYHDAMQLLPRVGLAALAINLSMFFAQTLIELDNALCGLVAAPLAQVLKLIEVSGSGLAFAVLVLAFGLAALLLVLQMIVRLAMINLLIVASPLALLCWVLPQTEAWAYLWTRAFFSTVLVQFLQILTLALGGALIGIFQVSGLFAGAIDLLVGLATVYAAFKVPTFLRGIGGPAAPNPLNDAAGVAGTALLVARLAAFAA